MHKFSAAALVSVTLLLISGCVGESAPVETGSAQSADSAPKFDSVKTPSSAPPSAADMPMSDAGDGGGKPEAKDPSGIEIVPQSESDKPLPKRESIAGRWEFLLSVFVEDIVGLLIEIEQTDDGYKAKIVDDSQMMPKWSIESAELTDKAASIRFANHKGDPVQFYGSLQPDGIVRGNVSFGTESRDLAFWLPSQRDTLDDADQKIPAQQIEELQGFQPSSENALVEVREKAGKLIPSTLAYHFFRSLAARVRQEVPDEGYFDKFPEEYLAAAAPWGARIVADATVDLAYTSALSGYSAETTQKYLSQAEKQLGDDATPVQQSRLKVARGMALLSSEESSDQQSGVGLLGEILEDHPYNTDVPKGLAAYYERTDQPAEALASYAAVAVLPTGAGDMGPVVRLWKELGRDPKTLDAYLDEVYKDLIYQFADGTSDATRADGTQQTILGELFTGGSCPPCVAADVATGGLEKTYPKSDFIMLRYHQHIPGPDPLSTRAGEQRARSYYDVQGTPTLLINGQNVDSVYTMYGPLTNAPAGYADLREIVDSLLTESSDVSINLTATVTGETIEISADVTGPEKLPETWRLRLCLTEDEIMHPARNGIRMHEMVVRAMPGGPDGIAAADGLLSFTDSVTLEAVRDSIRADLVRIPGLSPPSMEMAHLHVVAFVQDDSDRSIIQAVAAPVTISADTPVETPEQPTDDAS